MQITHLFFFYFKDIIKFWLFLIAKVVWTKSGIPAGNQNKSTEGARDGNIPTQWPTQGEWKWCRVHSHPSRWASWELNISLRFRNKTHWMLETKQQDCVWWRWMYNLSKTAKVFEKTMLMVFFSFTMQSAFYNVTFVVNWCYTNKTEPNSIELNPVWNKNHNLFFLVTSENS